MAEGRGGAQALEPAVSGGRDRHFSDVVSAAVLSYVADAAGVAPDELLRLAGDERAAADVTSGAGWSDHGQFRALLQSAASALGGTAGLRGLGAALPFDDDADPYLGALHALGSPADLYRAVDELASVFIPAARLTAEVDSATSCTVRMVLQPGLEPFGELCALLAGLLSLLPRPFGCDTAAVDHPECTCDGGEVCVFEVSWDEPGRPEALRELALRNRRAERGRLEGLIETMGSVAAGSGIEETLEHLVRSTQRAASGLGVVLALRPGTPSATTVFTSGVDPERAAAVATQLAGDGDRFDGLVVPVAADGRGFGHLAVVPPMGVVTQDQLEVLEAAAQIAATALASDEALTGARRRADGAAGLVELSAGLADAISLDDAAARVAGALPGLLDCDQAVVVVRDRHLPIGRLAAVHGFPLEVTDRLERLVVAMFDPSATPELRDAGSEPLTEIDRCMVLGGSSSWLSLPLVADDEVVGVLVAGVRALPERLLAPASEAGAMQDMLRVAAIALRGAALQEQARHDALHDPLTGVGHRALFLDRLTLSLLRSRRTGTAGAVLVADLDGGTALNDRIGRSSTDLVLQAMAGRLTQVLRRADAVCRVGSDAFAAVLEGAGGDVLHAVAERVLVVLRRPFVLGPGMEPVTATVSLGLAAYDPAADADAESVLADALAAQETARAAGGDRAEVRTRSSPPG